MRKRTIILIAMFSLLICVTTIQSAYGKYTSSATANTNVAVARWNILINNQDITNNSDFSSTITPVFEGSEYIASNIIAPTAEGYFDITINGENTDVAFTSTITLNIDETSDVTDLVISRYSIVGSNETTTFDEGTPTITKTFGLNDTKTITYRVYVKWNDGSGSTMTNQNDTDVTNTGVAKVLVNVNVTQYNG